VVHVLKNVLNVPTELVWHKEFKHSGYDAVVLPGGFSYGDHLRCGVIAARSPAMEEVKLMAEEGKPVLGICNGFQILVEAEILPGAFLPNDSLKFICKWIILRCETAHTAFTSLISEGQMLHMPIAHHEGRYFHEAEALKALSFSRRIVFRYVDEKGEPSSKANPNGAVGNIAAIANERGNVLGIMPHPERASEPILNPSRRRDGALIFQSMVDYIKH
jgi:phosphoribosylformylglycinamidine synthase